MRDTTFLPNGTWLSSMQYCIERPLGAGGFGKTYLVRSRLGKYMVVKEFFISTMCTRDEANNVAISVEANRKTFNEQRRKFENEALIINTLSHPNIVKVLAIFEENNTLYYVMEYVDGESLSDKLNRGFHFTEQQIKHYLDQLLDALEYIHSLTPKALIHLDIKPGNILIDKNNNVVLIDFGASKLFNSQSVNKTLMSSNRPPYTLGYAPLEQENGDVEDIGPNCDIYALGATLYKLFTLKNPPMPYKVMSKGLPEIPQASPLMQKVIKKAMAAYIDDRIQSVAEFRAMLSDYDNSTEEEQSTLDETHLVDLNETKNQQDETPQLQLNDNENESEYEHVLMEHDEVNRFKSIKNILKWIGFLLLFFCITYIGLLAYYHLSIDRAIKPTNVQSTVCTVGGVSFYMVDVDGGTFKMGAQKPTLLENLLEMLNIAESDSINDDVYPSHSVTLNDYQIGETEVTQGLWDAVMNYEGRVSNGTYLRPHTSITKTDNNAQSQSSNFPIYSVSYNEIVNIFLPRLSKITGKEFRLLTEAEWEFAARGGNKSRGCKYSGSDDINDVAHSSYSSSIAAVKLMSANELGIFDMSGNVSEWCSDWYDSYSMSSQNNPKGPSSGTTRVLRDCDRNGVLSRDYERPEIKRDKCGFRLACSR